MSKSKLNTIPERFFTLVSGFRTWSSYNDPSVKDQVWLYFGDTNSNPPTEEETWATCVKLAYSPKVKKVMGDTFCVMPLYPNTPYYYPPQLVSKEETITLTDTHKLRISLPQEYKFPIFNSDTYKTVMSQAYSWGDHRDSTDECLAIVVIPEPLNILINLLQKSFNKRISLIVVTPEDTIQLPDFNNTQLSCVSPYKFLGECSKCLLMCPTEKDCTPRLLLNEVHSLNNRTQLTFSDAKEQWKPGKTTIEDFTFISPMYTAIHTFTKYKRPITQHTDLTASLLYDQRVKAQKLRQENKVRTVACQTLECTRCFLQSSCYAESRARYCEGHYHPTNHEAYDYVIAKVENPYTFKQTMTLLYNSGKCVNRYNNRIVHSSLDLVANKHIIFGIKYVYKPPKDPNTKKGLPDPFIGKHPLTYTAAKKLLTQLNGTFLELPNTFYPWIKKHKKEALAVLYETLAIDRIYNRAGWGSRTIFPISVSMRPEVPKPTTSLDMAWTLTITCKRYSGGVHPNDPDISSLDDIFKLKNRFNLLKQVRYIPTYEQLSLF